MVNKKSLVIVPQFEQSYTNLKPEEKESIKSAEEEQGIKELFSRTYRSELGIAVEILNATINNGSEGEIISRIARSANISHYVAVGICQKLVQGDCLKFIEEGRKKIFKITEKGISFVRLFENFIEMNRGIHSRI